MIELKSVSKSYGKKVVLDQVDLQIPKGQVTFLVGENGSGKSTLMNLIMRLIPKGKGEILLDGQVMTEADYNRVAYVPDQIIVLKNQTIQQALDFMQDYYQAFNRSRALEMLEFFHLNAEDRIDELSKGNVAKVNLLLGLALDSEYILMDEPFAGIDLFTREEISQVFCSKLIEGQGVLISSHDVQEVEFMIDQAVFLQDGRIVDQLQLEDYREATGKGLIDRMREVYRGE
ncbi:multidrug ABC transporter ATP-binding protein [Facklamia sp. HMSC062C11]|uniref:ABC transporter ATP-binding protein n=1 Tax=Facklamia hominis TaxID=178214 RepID=A0AAJ1Q4N6_9LACT|nr:MULTISPECIES: ABC transporter ATP-binding protein [Facklamia]MDK7187597.1 ABC transporter ATP-binding protein [Facklamia hominis]OFL64612.1 multidrug ABC transporter ATP-binding protein [Facklamia sp. HMSC062C11]